MAGLRGWQWPRPRLVEVTGLLGAVGWGLDDRVTRVAIFTADEEVYELDLDDLQDELLRCLRRVLVVQGELTQAPGGAKAITLSEYRVLE